MTSSTIVSIVHLVTSDAQAREEVVKKVQNIITYSRENEPGVLKYALCRPDNSVATSSQDTTSVFIIEEYTNKQVYDQHMSSAPVVDLLTSAQKSGWLQASTKIYNVAWLSDAILSRPERLPSQLPNSTTGASRVQAPYILLATITDPDTQDIDALEPYGAAIVRFATSNEPNTIFYADGRPLDITTGKVLDSLNGDKLGFICAVEVYASKQACDTHLKDDSVRALAVQGHKLGSKFDIQRMIVEGGWLVRE